VKRVAPYATLRKQVTASYPRSQAINKAYPSRKRATRTVVPDRIARSRRQIENAFNSGAMHQRTGISKSLNASVHKEEPSMRSIPIALAAFVISGPAAAQSWQEYSYPDYAFSVTFPANPQVETTNDRGRTTGDCR
jgi:hypothetical protein